MKKVVTAASFLAVLYLALTELALAQDPAPSAVLSFQGEPGAICEGSASVDIVADLVGATEATFFSITVSYDSVLLLAVPTSDYVAPSCSDGFCDFDTGFPGLPVGSRLPNSGVIGSILFEYRDETKIEANPAGNIVFNPGGYMGNWDQGGFFNPLGQTETFEFAVCSPVAIGEPQGFRATTTNASLPGFLTAAAILFALSFLISIGSYES